MALTGKGFFIWKVKSCENGNPSAIASTAHAAGLTHVLIKIADGPNPFNIDSSRNTDLLPPVVESLHANGIQVWGWHYVYGYNPAGEAQIAAQRVLGLNLDGYVIDAEKEYKLAGRAAVARTFMNELRRRLPDTLVALSSFRFPTYHPQIPWKEFLQQCDFNMPQVYWEQAHNPGVQLRRCIEEFSSLAPVRPIIPTGCAYGAGSWAPKPMEMTEFLNTARELKLSAANLYSWDYSRANLKSCWETAAAFKWDETPNPPPAPKDTPELIIEGLNQHNPDGILALYHPQAIHISRGLTIQGLNGIKEWYASFFNQEIPQAEFKLKNTQDSGITRHFTWEASNSTKEIENGKDTIGLLNGKILYHYTTYNIKNRV
jgi:hypothetical protein